MTIPFSKKLSVPAGVLVQELDGETVFLNINSGQYYGLDAVGTRMWQVLTKAASIQAAYDTLLSEYEVDAKTLSQDLQGLVEKLIKHELVATSG